MQKQKGQTEIKCIYPLLALAIADADDDRA